MGVNYNSNAVGISEFSGHEGNNNFVGLNDQSLQTVKGALLELIKNAKATLDKMQDEMNPNIAFKGEELEKAVKTFIGNVKTEGQEWLSQIGKYCEEIDKLLEGSATQQSTMASELDTESRNVSSQTTEYTYQGSTSSSSAS